MGLPKCNRCGKPFKWRTIIKNIWGIYRPITCNNCGTKNKITYLSRVLVSLSIILPMLIFGFYLSSYSIGVRLIYMVLMGICISTFIPFFIKYESYH
ncbi:TIGR04104 family putative zinc finger protein [Bacillus sp. es.036]|uniref:TIGR04104 family putative zinc finger protein n=1 Tax=Bacillus sp. es.036 TaxID=1761764 RepID=UPI000BF8EAAB|nr:CXXC-20-CXXC protein [Bacillus sp. es.036]